LRLLAVGLVPRLDVRGEDFMLQRLADPALERLVLAEHIGVALLLAGG